MIRASPDMVPNMRIIRITAVYLSMALLTACANTMDSLPFVYRMDVEQGTPIEQEKINQLRKGMTREQVRFVLGPPAVTDVFHPDRWDYVHTMKRGKGDVEIRRFAVFFEGDALVAVSGEIETQDPSLVRGKDS